MDILRIVEFGNWGPEDTGSQNWNYQRWLQAVKNNLQIISTTCSGRAVYRQLLSVAGTERKMIIKAGPLHPKPGTHQAGVIPHWDGTAVDINFTPMSWRDPSSVLLHELYHAIGELDGTTWWDLQALDGSFHTKGELVAIAIANLYRLEQGHKLLRVDHLGPAETKWRSPREAAFFFAAQHSTFRQFMHFRRALCAELAELKPKGYDDHLYNPFRAAHKPETIAHLLEGLKNRQRLDDLFAMPG